MKQHIVKATIYATDQLKVKYAVCRLDQVHYEDETYEYIFTPNYSVIDLLDTDVFQGIPGLKLELRKECYIRKNKIPTFIYERTPQENREDLWEYLDSAGLEYLDYLEWLIRTDYKYTGDNLSVGKYIAPRDRSELTEVNPGDRCYLVHVKDISNNNFRRFKLLLEVISKGAYLTAGNFSINDHNRKGMHDLIRAVYETEVIKRARTQRNGIDAAKVVKKYTGRRKIKVSLPLLAEVVEDLDQKRITISEAMEQLGLKSRSTLYRRIKEFKEDHLN